MSEPTQIGNIDDDPDNWNWLRDAEAADDEADDDAAEDEQP